ncbi:MAG: hypothetical protein Q8L78_09180 [Coxiellaceae bacterium]|nr:hypothetical protein [Coxiellaceae bacterium]
MWRKSSNKRPRDESTNGVPAIASVMVTTSGTVGEPASVCTDTSSSEEALLSIDIVALESFYYIPETVSLFPREPRQPSKFSLFVSHEMNKTCSAISALEAMTPRILSSIPQDGRTVKSYVFPIAKKDEVRDILSRNNPAILAVFDECFNAKPVASARNEP